MEDDEPTDTLGTSTSDGSTQGPVEGVPNSVVAARPLAADYYRAVTNHSDDARVFVTRDGEIVMEYSTHSETADELETELHLFADLFVDVVAEGEYDPVTISIITGTVEAIATEPAIEAYVSGDLEKAAFFETVEILGVERSNE
ncbi:hypothetical protein [Halovivax cerinus]